MQFDLTQWYTEWNPLVVANHCLAYVNPNSGDKKKKSELEELVLSDF